MFDLRSHILSVNDKKYISVDVPEWPMQDGTPTKVWIRTLAGDERDEFEASTIKEYKRKRKGRAVTERKQELRGIRAKLVVLTACKGPDDPTPIFQPSDAELLGSKSSAALDRLWEVASRLAGLSEDDVEELAGN